MELGIYSDVGKYTCQQCPGSYGHERIDVNTFAEWGASYLKLDRCFGVDSEVVREDLKETFQIYRKEAER